MIIVKHCIFCLQTERDCSKGCKEIACPRGSPNYEFGIEMAQFVHNDNGNAIELLSTHNERIVNKLKKTQPTPRL